MPDAATAEIAGRPIAEGLFTWPDDPRLIASSCERCGTTTFPAQGSCPRCTATDMREVKLARRGKLWTWTIQGFQPKSPYLAEDGEFQPYGVGYIELAAEAEGASPVLVEARLSVADAELLRIGDEMELSIVPFRQAEDGTPLLTFEFHPVTTPAD